MVHDGSRREDWTVLGRVVGAAAELWGLGERPASEMKGGAECFSVETSGAVRAEEPCHERHGKGKREWRVEKMLEGCRVEGKEEWQKAKGR